GYALAIVNSDNSSKIEDFKDKVIAFDLNAKLMDKHIVIDVSGDDGGLPTASSITDVSFPNNNTPDTTKATNVSESNSLWKVAAAYTSSQREFDSETFVAFESNSLWKVAAAYTSSPFTVGVVYANHTLGGQSKSVAGNDAVQTDLSIFAHA